MSHVADLLDSQKSPTTAPRRLRPVDDLEKWLERGRSEVFSVVADVSPRLAARLLERNDANRTITQKHLNSLVHKIRVGDFALNGETIIISRDGLLNDGQHRLAAVVEADRTVPMILVFGVERETRTTVDQGKARLMGHVFAMNGIRSSNSLALAAIVRWCLNFLAGNTASNNADFSEREYLDFASEHTDELEEAGVQSRLLAKAYRTSPAALGMAIFFCNRIDKGACSELVQKMITGIGIAADDPAAALRRRYQDHVAGNSRLTYIEQAAFFIKAFNATAAGRPMHVVKWLKEEAFPAPTRPARRG